MNIDFLVSRVDDSTIEVVDNSYKNDFKFPPTINSMTLNVVNQKEGIRKEYDLIEYLLNGREYKELCFIKASDLGKNTLPDGIYEITYKVNEEYINTRRFIFTYNLDQKFKELSNSINREVEVNSLGKVIIKDSFDTETMNTKKLNVAVALYTDLTEANFRNDDTEIYKILNQLNRLL